MPPNYTHVARKGPAGVTSPLDVLGEFAPEEIQAAVLANRFMPPSHRADKPDDEFDDE